MFSIIVPVAVDGENRYASLEHGLGCPHGGLPAGQF
jgi:hypothetical protein